MIVAMILLDVIIPPSASPRGVDPIGGSHGFAAAIVGGFLGLGILILAMVLISLRPRRAPQIPND